MSFESEYFALRKKRKEEELRAAAESALGTNSFSDEYLKLRAQSIASNEAKLDNEIAPIRTASGELTDYAKNLAKEKLKEKNKDDGGLDFFDSGVFSDGYDFGDVTKTILGTLGDVGVNVVKGAGNLIEGIADAGQHFSADVMGWLGDETYAKVARDMANKNMVDDALQGADDWLDDYSVLGRTSQGIAQGAGQIGLILATGGAAGALGAGAAATSAITLGMTGASGVGSGMSEAYNSGATDEEAHIYGLISGASDVVTEMIFGGMGKGAKALGFSKGLSSADDIVAKGVSKAFNGQLGKTLAEVGVKAGAEGLEEVLAGGAQAIGKKLTYMSEEDLGKILADENLLEQFVVGSFTSGLAQGGDVRTSLKTGTDLVTGLTQNEQKVIDKVYKDTITEAEKDGNKLTKKQKNEVYESLLKDLDKGYISLDTIEETLGGDTYKQLTELNKKETADLEELAKLYEGDELTKRTEEYLANSKKGDLKSQLSNEVSNLVSGSRLAESYLEQSRREEAFQIDLETVDKKYRDTYQRALESGVLNNTNRTRELVSLVAKLEADGKGTYNFADNKKLAESGFSVEGKTINGIKGADNNVTINVQSKKFLNSVVGHEVTHVLEGTELYNELQSAVFEFAKSKGEYESRFKAIDAIYSTVEGYKGADGMEKIRAELTADLVGDYLFQDADFVRHLSTKNRNVFEKIYDEIKYLCKVVTAGSKEARQLERAKKAFEDVYREGKVSASTDTKLSLSDSKTDSEGKALTEGQQTYFQNSKMRDDNGNLMPMYHGSQDAGFHVFDSKFSDDGTSFFFADSPLVAESYSGSPEVYEAKTIRSAEDMNNFLAEIGEEDYRVVEKDGKFTLLQENEFVAESDTAQGIYEEYCDWTGTGFGDANYKVYLNLKNPLVIDAEGRNWNNIATEFSQEKFDAYYSLTEAEREVLKQVASWEDLGIFVDEFNKALADMESGSFVDEYAKNLASAVKKLGGYDADPFEVFDVVNNDFTDESISENATKKLKTRDFAQRAREQGYDGVIFKNIVDNGSWESKAKTSTVAVAFDSNQIKSTANENPTGDKDIRYSLSAENGNLGLDKSQNLVYNGRRGDTYVRTDEFRNLQAESQRMSDEEWHFYLRGGENEVVRRRVSAVLQRQMDTWRRSRGFGNGVLNLSAKGNQFNIYEEVDGSLFHDIFEVTRKYLKNGELVDPHGIETTEDGIGYNDCRNYLSEDGLSGFSITPDGDLISVFNASGKSGFLRAISDVVKKNAKTLDCFMSPNQNLVEMYSAAFGFKTASVMDYNMEYDHDKIAENHGMPQVAFMVNTEQDVETRNFTKDQYDEAKAYRDGFVEQATDNPVASFMPKAAVNPYSVSNLTERPKRYGNLAISGDDVRYRGDISPVEEGVAENATTTKAETVQKSDERRAAEYRLEEIKRESEEFGIDFEYQKMFAQVERGRIGDGHDALGRNYSIRKKSNGKYIATCEALSFGGGFIQNDFEIECDTFDEAYLTIQEHLFKDNAEGRDAILKEHEGVAPVVETAQASTENVQKPDSDALFEEWKALRSVKNRTEAQNLRLAELKEQISAQDKAAKAADAEMLADDIAPIPEEELAARDKERLESLTDADATEEDILNGYADNQNDPSMPEDPLADRDFYSVGKDRKTKAYMYDHPEVKPYFQQMAEWILTDLANSSPAESHYNDQLYYETNGEAGIYRLPRDTTDGLADYKDKTTDTYEDIRKGLKAIIEDNGRENNAVSKRLEFLIHEQLMNGYTDMSGTYTPPNQEYIDTLKRLQAAEAVTQQGVDSAQHLTDSIAPPIHEEVTHANEPIQDAPIKEQFEAIKPKPKKKAKTENKLIRVKDDSAPIAPDMEERSWYETSSKSEAVDGAVKPEDIPNELRYYQVKHNKDTVDSANEQLNKLGYEKAVTYFEGKITDKNAKLTPEDIALGERLIQEAVKQGDIKTATDLIIDVSILGTELGQQVQALSIIQRLTPEGQLKALHRMVERGKAKGDKAFEGVEVTEDIAKPILETRKADGTFDQKELNAAVEQAKNKIAEQMKVTKLEQANAIRYFSMLGNPKTHGRNIISTAANFVTRAVKNVIARTVEDVALRKSGNRTKTWKRASDAVKAFARKTMQEQKDVIKGNAYSDTTDLKQRRHTWKNKGAGKVANAVTEFNSNAMEAEDSWFSLPTYRLSLAEYLTANGIETQQDIDNNPELVEKAKAYALEEARKATFRQDSYMASKIAEIERKNAIVGAAVGSVMPFKKTPINVAKTGVAYSPLGLVRGLYNLTRVKSGKVDATAAIDQIAQGLTGSAITMLGYALASMGVLNGAGEDDKEGDYDYQLGEQSYSISIGGNTYSLSWLSPVSMPLFVGANAFETLVEGEELDFNTVADALGKTLDPLTEMSFVSSLDDVLSSYGSGTDKLLGAAESMAQNYITQYIPTLSSQLASTLDDTKRSTRPSRDSEYTFGEETWNQIKYKIPGLRNTLEPQTDIWGNEVANNQNPLTNFLAPWNEKAGIATEIDEELKELYGETGETELLPSIPYNYTNFDGEKYEMSAEEHTAYKQMYGQTANKLLSELFETETYKNGDTELRAQMVGRVYDYARDEAKKQFFDGRDVYYTNAESDGTAYYKEDAIKGAIEYDMTVDEYTFYSTYTDKYNFFKSSGISYEAYAAADEDGKRAYTWAYENQGKYEVSKAISDDYLTFYGYKSTMNDFDAKDESGETVSGLKKERIIDYINGLDIDYGQKILLFKMQYKTDDTYNMDIIDYLNSRDDISYSQMEAMLKALGFTVRSDGYVTWD